MQELSRKGRAVVQGYSDFEGILDNMVVRDDQARRIEDETRPNEGFDFTGIADGRRGACGIDLRRGDFLVDRDIDHGRQQPADQFASAGSDFLCRRGGCGADQSKCEDSQRAMEFAVLHLAALRFSELRHRSFGSHDSRIGQSQWDRTKGDRHPG